jgi:diguanylate cyclase (GGDEF)-like protein
MTEKSSGLGKSNIIASSVDEANDDFNHSVEAAKKMFEKLATDPLTGLLRKEQFEQKLAELMNTSTSVGILHLDLDGFKAVNDTKGHAAGDSVLAKIGQLLRSSDITGRLGGDEFAIAVDLEVKDNERRGQNDLTPEERLDAVKEKVQKVIEEDTELKQSGIGVSIGSAIASPGIELEQLLHQADQAMYEQKQQRKSGNAA